MIENLATFAALASVALVLPTLYLLIRQTKIAQLQTARVIQLELVKLSVERPELAVSNDNPTPEYAKDQMRNLWMMYFQMNWLIGASTPAETREAILGTLFSTPSGKSWWTPARSTRWHRGARGSRRLRAFAELVDEVHLGS